ncbi:MAG: hypothetical protein FWD27_04015 [Coriobacteriia bacterium]|nr:hypothetical protein [Coriobacteriia bacterium]
MQSLIQEYVVSAHPVASSTLAQHYVPLLSAATIRNELSWLENQGYVVSPHTSAGRMPTTSGYRTFVNSLLLHPQLYGAIAHRSIVREGAGNNTVGAWQSQATKPLLASIAAASDKLALVPDVLRFFAEQNKSLMVFWAPQLSNSIIHRGLPLLLTQPEFAEASAVLPIMQLLESHGSLMTIFEEIVSADYLHIKIGSEHKDTQLYEFSLVAMRFDCTCLLGEQKNNKSAAKSAKNYGVVALFGPTRMDYAWAISSISSLVKNLERPA